MARLPYSSERLAVFTASQGDRIAHHLQSSVRLMLIAATLLLIINTATAAAYSPTCTSNVVNDCYLPQNENDTIDYGRNFSGYDASVHINSDGVSITLENSKEPKWPELKLLVPENFNMTVSPKIPYEGTDTSHRFWYRIFDDGDVWQVTRRDDSATQSDSTYWLSLSCDKELKISLNKTPSPNFEFLADGSIAGYPSCIPIKRRRDPAITGKTVITLQPAAPKEFKVPTGSYVTLKLTGAMIMLDSAFRQTTVAPSTTTNVTITNNSSTEGATTKASVNDGGMAPWIIAVVVVGSLLFLAGLIGLAVFFIVIFPRMRGKKGAMEQSSGYAESSAKPTKKKRGKKGNKTSKKDAGGSKKTKRTTKEGKPEQENTPSVNTRPEDAPPPNGYPEQPAADPITPAPADAPAPGVEQAYENLGPMPPPQQPVENLAP